MRDYMGRRVTPPKRVISPTWGPPPPCKQALSLWQALRKQGRRANKASQEKVRRAWCGEGCALFASLGASKKEKRKKKLTEGNAHSGNWEMWISSKLFLDQLNAWINQKQESIGSCQKLVSGKVHKLLFFIVKRKFNRRHYKNNILHFFIRELDLWTWLRWADVSGIRLPFNYNH